MASNSLNFTSIRDARLKLGASDLLSQAAEVTIVGGAAGLLTGALSPLWTTSDVDAIDFRLPQDRDNILEAAEQIGRSNALPADWLNDWSGLFAWTLPDAWRSRRVHIGRFGYLDFYAVSRQDLIAMKFVAHRHVDIEHLHNLNVNDEDLKFVLAYLQVLDERFPLGKFPMESGKVEMARHYVAAWRSK